MDPAAGEFFANGTEVEVSGGQIVRDAVVLGWSSETYFVRFKANTPGVAGHVREVGREDIRPVQPPEQQEEFELYDEVGVYWMGCWSVTVIMGEGIYAVQLQSTLERPLFDLSRLRLHWEWVDGQWHPAHPRRAVGPLVEVLVGQHRWCQANIVRSNSTGHEVVCYKGR